MVLRKDRKKIKFDEDAASSMLSLGEALGLDAPQPEAVPAATVPEPTSDRPQEMPRFSKAVLQRARSGGGKWTVRVLLTPRPTPDQLETLLRGMRRGLGTGARAEDGVPVIQGDIPDRIEEWLLRRGVQKITR